MLPVAVLVPSFNRGPELGSCLRALEEQAYRGFDTLVIDNGGDEGVAALLAREFPHVATLKIDEPVGSAGGFAAGLQAARERGAEWCWLIDDDMIPDPPALERLVAAACAQPEHVYGSVAVDPETRSTLCWYTTIRRDGRWSTVRDREALGDDPLVEAMEMGYMGLFLPRAVLDQVGYPEPRLFTKVDDVDYYLRIRQAGFRMFYVTGSLVVHPAAEYARPWPIGRAWAFPVLAEPWKEYYLTRNSMYVWLKYDGRLRSLLLHAPGLLPRVLYALVRRDRKWERCTSQFRGLVDGRRGRLGRTVWPA